MKINICHLELSVLYRININTLGPLFNTIIISSFTNIHFLSDGPQQHGNVLLPAVTFS